MHPALPPVPRSSRSAPEAFGRYLGIVSPFTDRTFKPFDWRPREWEQAARLHYLSVASHFPSDKNGRPMPCESTLEDDMACLLEIDDAVTAFREQPVGPDWHDGHGWREGTARDFWVETDAGNVLVEVKERKELADPDVRDRFRRMALSYRLNGVRLVVRSETTIRAQPRLENCRILLRAAGSEDPRLEAAMRDALATLPETATVREFRSFLGDEPATILGLSRLALAGEIAFDMNRPIDADAEVRW